MGLLRARGLVELDKVASGSYAEDLWLGDRKVGSQVVGEIRSRLPGGGIVGKIKGKDDKEEEPATEQSRDYTDLGFDLNEREKQVTRHASTLA